MTTPVKTSTIFGTLGPANAGLRMSVEEFLDHDDWEQGPRYQLIGLLIVSPEVSGGERFPNDETYSTPLLPGFILPLKKIFDIADRHSKKKK